ncbi:MAG: hypothetical protein LBI63_03240 [Candidatus Ancillula sp.]|jgi:hypothetical protein|nr:hypothetical protein [Candidatus Ancillula sp.]
MMIEDTNTNSKPKRYLEVKKSSAKMPKDVMLELETHDEILQFKLGNSQIRSLLGQLKKAIGEE